MFSQSPYPPTPTFQAKYVSTHKRAQIVRILLMVGIALSVVSLGFSLMQYAFPELMDFEAETPGAATIVIALLVMGLALLEIAVYIATIVFFLMWLYRSRENLPAFGVPRNSIQYSSGWAVGSWFIPFVSLVVPYRAVKELWNKSVPNSGTMFGDQSPPAVFPLWWAAWLLSTITSNAYLRLSFSDQLSREADATLGAVTAAFSIVAALFAIKVVNEIDKQQIESSKVMPHHFVSQTPPLPDLFANEAAQPLPRS